MVEVVLVAVADAVFEVLPVPFFALMSAGVGLPALVFVATRGRLLAAVGHLHAVEDALGLFGGFGGLGLVVGLAGAFQVARDLLLEPGDEVVGQILSFLEYVDELLPHFLFGALELAREADDDDFHEVVQMLERVQFLQNRGQFLFDQLRNRLSELLVLTEVNFHVRAHSL